MKKIFLIMLSAGLAFSFSGCEKTESVNQNAVVSSPVQANVESANTNANSSANANVAVADAPVPVFTDEKTAIAEGNKFLDSNATEKAIEAYNQAIKLNPESGEAYFRLGIAHLTFENEKEAAQVNEDPNPTPTPKGKQRKVLKKGVIEIPDTDSAKSFEKAIKAYEKHLKKNAQDDAAFFNLGRSYNKLNKDKEAEKAFKEAVKIKPEDAEYQTEYGAILVKLAEYDRAIPVLKKAIKLDENSKAQELLEKAEAGKKRIDFGAQQKAKQIAAQQPKQQ